MRKLMMTLVLASTAIAAAPAAAQGYGGRARNVQAEINQIEQRIDRAAQRRTISRQEAVRLHRQADQIDRLFDRYRRDGLSRSERNDIERRVDGLQRQLRFERRDNNRR